jgi:hypothetical protein
MGTFIYDVRFKMTPKNRTLGGRMVSNDQKQIRHNLWMLPKTVGTLKKN